MNNIELVEKATQKVYDPEFPFIDIYTMGLIYNIQINEEIKEVEITMSLTSPTCPMGDLIQQLVIDQVESDLKWYSCKTELTFQPPRQPDMIKDEDIKKMFE